MHVYTCVIHANTVGYYMYMYSTVQIYHFLQRTVYVHAWWSVQAWWVVYAQYVCHTIYMYMYSICTCTHTVCTLKFTYTRLVFCVARRAARTGWSGPIGVVFAPVAILSGSFSLWALPLALSVRSDQLLSSNQITKQPVNDLPGLLFVTRGEDRISETIETDINSQKKAS